MQHFVPLQYKCGHEMSHHLMWWVQDMHPCKYGFASRRLLGVSPSISAEGDSTRTHSVDIKRWKKSCREVPFPPRDLNPHHPVLLQAEFDGSYFCPVAFHFCYMHPTTGVMWLYSCQISRYKVEALHCKNFGMRGTQRFGVIMVASTCCMLVDMPCMLL